MEIQTQRLKLRAPTSADAPAIAALANELDVTRFLSSLPHPYSLDDASIWVDNALMPKESDAQFVIEANGQLVGTIGISPQKKPQFEIGYWIGKPHWGQGYASEALKALTRWSPKAIGARVLMAGHMEDNPASARVLINNGFLYTGVREMRFSKALGIERKVRMMMRFA